MTEDEVGKQFVRAWPAREKLEGRTYVLPAGMYLGMPVRVDPTLPPDTIELRSGNYVVRKRLT